MHSRVRLYTLSSRKIERFRKWGKKNVHSSSFYLFFQLSQTYIQDYGTLLCYGSNELGTQTEPCVFNIIPAGKQKRDRKEKFSPLFNFPHTNILYILSKIFFSLFFSYCANFLSHSLHARLHFWCRSRFSTPFWMLLMFSIGILLSTSQANPIHCPIVRYWIRHLTCCKLYARKASMVVSSRVSWLKFMFMDIRIYLVPLVQSEYGCE